ncbi:MAG: haloacid dehalogenase-like hydrolase [Lachnospiraceae bacterium]|nr:haloacid dehalogenase-like hydrolase [Lachnospiraceae bacterium]
MSEKPIIALMYDFDHTLSPKDMQEYAFIPGLGIEAEDFWAECAQTAKEHQMDAILAYMFVMIEKARGKLLVTKDTLTALGKEVKLFPGVSTWFKRVNEYAESKGLVCEHYILSSGLKEIIEGTSIAKEFKEIYAASFCYDKDGIPVWPAMAVNYTSKTQFMYRINKGVLDVTKDKELNEYMPDDMKRVPFRNMVYIGDGLTDVPCMKLAKANGGYSVAVYQEKKKAANDMLKHGRVDYVALTDYSKGSEMEKVIFELIDSMAATDVIVKRHLKHLSDAESENI